MTQFLSTPSARRATPKYHEKQYNRSDFYPRPLRGGRPVNNGCSETPQQISIHALCEEGDPRRRLLLPLCRNFYPRLCEEGDSTPARRRSWLIYFYPRPLRGGRPSPSRLTPSSCYFYPRPLRGGRPDAGPARLIDLLGISIHALCEEGDVSAPFIKHSHKIFLSTPSARRATGEQRAPVARSQISIHALCEEGDRLLWDEPKIFFLISIHALCEEGDR